MTPPPPRSTLFPYTTLFRSERHREEGADMSLELHHVDTLEVLTDARIGEDLHIERVERPADRLRATQRVVKTHDSSLSSESATFARIALTRVKSPVLERSRY